MQVRFPKWDFSKVSPHWAPNHEFAQIYNAASTVPAYIEPYLVKVMLKAQAVLAPEFEALHQDLAIFIKQEMQHCKQHLSFNKMLRASYPGMQEMEQRYAADYDHFLATKSLRFNCAYSEGFEAMSAIAVTAFFEEFDPFLKDADPGAVDLWKWHLAEEFEHREVAHAVFHTLFGRNRVAAYFYRIYGFIYAVSHIRGHVRRVSQYLLAKDREGMTPEELARSQAREAEVRRAAGKRAGEHLKAILSPFYDPAKRPEPRGVADYLARFAKVPPPAAGAPAA
ncbi:MAG: metal-dependent hydrolase [Azospirillaceae bacterium]|nr:metal-dependent hydrolase [Azospirillaceae bacterium]